MADDNLFSVQLVTPERVLIDGIASQVILRTADGDITFLAGHTPLVGAVEPGVVRVVGEGGDETRFAVHGGFVQVEQHVSASDVDGAAGPAPVGSSSSSSGGGSRVTVLAGIAEPADEIDVDRARAAHDATEARVAELAGAGGRSGSPAPSSDADAVVDIELVKAEAALRRSEVRLEAAGVAANASV